MTTSDEALREEFARAICVSKEIDPDGIGYGCGHSGGMPVGSVYPLWHAQLQSADALLPLIVRERAAEKERAAMIAAGFAICGCNGSQGPCNTDDTPLAIAAAIRNQGAAR